MRPVGLIHEEWIDQSGSLVVERRSMSGRPGFDSRPSQIKDLKLVVEAIQNTETIWRNLY